MIKVSVLMCVATTSLYAAGSPPAPATSAAQIAKVLAPVLKDLGFVRSRFRWYRYEKESILVVDIQPARFSPGPYINLGVYYREYGISDKPGIVDCHVDDRLTALTPDPLRGDELLNPWNDISPETRREELEAMIRMYGMPWLTSFSNIDRAKKVLAANPKAAHVAPIARAELLTSD